MYNPWRSPWGETWLEFAACREIGLEPFFPDDGCGRGGNTEDVRAAKRICAACPVRRKCLDAALYYERTTAKYDRAGVWGGYTGRERHRLWMRLKSMREVKLCRQDLHAIEPGQQRCRQCYDATRIA